MQFQPLGQLIDGELKHPIGKPRRQAAEGRRGAIQQFGVRQFGCELVGNLGLAAADLDQQLNVDELTHGAEDAAFSIGTATCGSVTSACSGSAADQLRMS